MLNGFFPDPSESFPVISAATRGGTYATFNPPTYGGRAPFSSPTYSATAVTLQGTTLVVNSTADRAVAGNTPHTGNAVGGNPEITLRSALQYANGVSGTSFIDFDIPTGDGGYNSGSGGYWSFSPNSSYPVINHTVVLDATTQPGYGTHPVVEINGSSAGSNVNGLTLDAGGSTITGLDVNRFTSPPSSSAGPAPPAT